MAWGKILMVYFVSLQTNLSITKNVILKCNPGLQKLLRPCCTESRISKYILLGENGNGKMESTKFSSHRTERQ